MTEDYIPYSPIDQISDLQKKLHELSKIIKNAEYRIKSFDRANTQPYHDHAFMEILREYIMNKPFCDLPTNPSQEMLAKFAVKRDSSNAQVLAIFESYFEIKDELERNDITLKFQERGED